METSSGVTISSEGPRGCGYRKEGGLYLVCDGPGQDCCRLPWPLDVCPTCGTGIKPSRGWTWIDAAGIFGGAITSGPPQCKTCPLSRPSELDRCGLIWVGEQHYATPEIFLQEVAEVGVSRRISTVPRDFTLGKTWVVLGHRKAIPGVTCPTCHGTGDKPGGGRKTPPCVECGATGFDVQPRAGIFSVFLPSRVEKIVAEDTTAEEAKEMRKKGLTPVVVRRIGEQQELGIGVES